MTRSLRFLAAALSCIAAHGAHAHDGHFLAGSHWHATDTWGLLVVLAGGAAALWLGGRGR
jgi:hypothetical protein